MNAPRLRVSAGLLLEYALMLLVLASVAWIVYFYLGNHYLPQPFIFNTFDTFMDWFNTAAYANGSGAYDKWHAVYPPLSFVFLRVFSVPSCYPNPIIARDCDWLGISAILFLYALSALLAWVAFRRSDRGTAIPRGIAFAFGFPMLFCLERGNLILATLPFFIVGYGGIIRSYPWRWLSIAITINFKPYLVLPSLALGFKRQWRSLEGAGLCAIAVYLITVAWFGSGDPFTLFENAGIWVRFTNGQFWEQSYFATSYAPLLLVKDSPFPILSYVSSGTVELLDWLIPSTIRASQLITLVGLAAIWLQPQALPTARVAALLVGVHLVTQSPGGYTLTFLLFLLFLERSHRIGPMIALSSAYLLSLSYDWILATVVNTDLLSWLSGHAVPVSFGLAVGQLVRPALVLLILWALAIDTITQVIRAHRTHRPVLGLAPA